MAKKKRQDLKDKLALITGGARNIGLAIAKELAAQGASIVLVDICRDLKTIPYALAGPNDLERAVQEISKMGVKALGLTCDIRKEVQVKAAFQQVIDRFGRLDILVNNAGVVSLYPITGLSEKAWDEVVDVCLKGTYLCCKYALHPMIKQRYGKIVNISSVAGLRGLGLGVHYCAAKHGIIGLTKALAMEAADHHINVNALCPGTTESPMLEGLASQIQHEGDPYEHFAQQHLFQDRRIPPQDIAQAVSWLVSDKSRSITGSVITVDAGWSAR
ncbi:MAG: mycofactocin-coupled SDR family oxidoreductase [Deltaproteobacteria bacterium]|nr:mycofactocin-coupled SDR family oxidoreductase [Deltaproteobacteria bacterium]